MSRSVLIALGIFLAVNMASGERVRFDNYRVYKVTPRTKDQLKFLANMQEYTNGTIYLSSVHTLGRSMHITVPPEKCEEFQQSLELRSIQYEVVHTNLQNRLDVEDNVISQRTSHYNWEQYQTLDSTYSWLDSLASRFSGQVKIIIGGSTYEKREIKGVKVSFKEGNKGIFIEGGIHAREWISPATVTFILNNILTNKDPEVRQIAESYDWYVFPHTNPDGYVYTHTTNRLWRKTRSATSDPECYGADPNRNWDFHWNEIGASSNPCSEIYAGEKAFSEIETRSLAKYIESLKGKIHTYLSVHAYSQLLLFPYGYTEEYVENHKDLQQIGDAAVKALAVRYGTSYLVGNVYEVVYPASGSSIDWAYKKINVSVTYAYELRPASDEWDGFLLPAHYIVPTGEETVDSVVAMVNEAKTLGYL